jgi:hypothetical protein
MLCALTLVGFLYLMPRRDFAYGFTLILVLLPIQVIALYLFDSTVAFIPSEIDAILYYVYSGGAFSMVNNHLAVPPDLLYGAGFDGGVYVRVLGAIGELVDDSLSLRKALSIASLWVLVFAWYRIGYSIKGRSFARKCALCIALLPTMWYPFLILYRDLLTAMLHAVFLAASIRCFQEPRRRSLDGTAVLVCLVLAYSLRPATVYINVAIVGIVGVVYFFGRTRGEGAKISGRWLGYGIAAATAAILLSVVLADVIGIKSPILSLQVALSPEELEMRVQSFGIARVLSFVPLFLASEPTIASRQLNFADVEQIRGILNGPWLLLGTPFAVVGLAASLSSPLARRGRRLVRSWMRAGKPQSSLSDQTQGGEVRFSPAGAVIEQTRAIDRRALLTVIGYTTIWFVVCLIVWDWTRWRLPAVPALVLIAVWGYDSLTTRERIVLLSLWGGAVLGWRVFF